MSFYIRVWGSMACFTRPEFKVERVSYDVITPSAARGILTSIYWHPGLSWVIDEIQVCKPVVTQGIVRNEIRDKIRVDFKKGTVSPVDASVPDQRNTVYLRDVEYIIKAHFEICKDTEGGRNTHTKEEFAAIIGQRMDKGGCFRTLYLGCREFGAFYERVDGFQECLPEFKGKSRDFGWMLLDLDYSDLDNIQPKFFRAVMEDGLIKIPLLKEGLG